MQTGCLFGHFGDYLRHLLLFDFSDGISELVREFCFQGLHFFKLRLHRLDPTNLFIELYIDTVF